MLIPNTTVYLKVKYITDSYTPVGCRAHKKVTYTYIIYITLQVRIVYILSNLLKQKANIPISFGPPLIKTLMILMQRPIHDFQLPLTSTRKKRLHTDSVQSC